MVSIYQLCFYAPRTSHSAAAPAAPAPWCPVNAGWVTLNTDDDVSHQSGQGSIGGIICDPNGNWIARFHRSINYANALQFELWAIHDNLLLAWSLGMECVQLQSNCLQAVSLTNAPDAAVCWNSIVRAIATLLNRAWVIDIIWIPRVANKLADLLAKMALGTSPRPTILDVPPDITRLLSLDMETAICRLALLVYFLDNHCI
ncbi:hypothetical protein V6N11_054141 [Hibiscus sabdariffa]|uniref:RNase H type-1 domain-containing protein n=1 Tax=Hibiscus sabdariffa TaxID=183260 RepID=A0ABR2S3N5_9ROSI